jgi:diguanylate cyclase
MTRHNAADAEPLLRQVVEQLCSLASASRPDLSSALGECRRAMRSQPSTQALQETLAMLTRLNGAEPCPEKRALDTREGRLVGAVLKALVVPTSLEPLAQSLERALGEATDDAGIDRLADQLLHLLTESRAQAERRQAELQDFLKATVNRLVQLESALGEAQTLSRRVGADAEQARQITELQVVQLRAVATQTEDLDQLKSFIGDRLDHLQEHLRQQDSSEGDHQARLEAQLGMLSQQVAALNAETVTLRSRLDVTTEEALRDPLTGAFNRLAYDRRAALEVARWRSDGGSLSMIVCDIDHFKRINDVHGHACGDRALQLVAASVVANLRTPDLVGRYGGDEFALLLRGARLGDAMAVAERIVDHLQDEAARLPLPLVPSLSFGMVQVLADESIDQALRRADQALYEAKRQGRGRAVSAHGDEALPVWGESRPIGLTPLYRS